MVIEKSWQVLKLIEDKLPEDIRLKIHIVDIRAFIHNTRQKFDYVYLDIVPVATPKSYATISLPLKMKAQRIALLENIICYEEIKGDD